MKLKSISCCVAVALTTWLSSAVAQPPALPLIVVEDRGGSSALPYYEAIAPQEDSRPPAEGTSGTEAPLGYSEADMLPVRTSGLTPGVVTQRSIQAPGLAPLFLIGDDDRSRSWLAQRLATLQQLRAVGLVVNVKTAAAMQALRALAPGLELAPVAADDLAQRLGLDHYPVLITISGIEQ